ncbi:MAG: hypothetical protein J6C81_02330 [Muribaculaceae bacterium]|nr:hypothetical protein [Muribaculaceae bacterium]
MIAAALTAAATNYSHLVIRQKDGKEIYVKSEALQFKVADDNLIVIQSGETLNLPLDQLSTMSFTADPLGIDNIADEDSTPVDVYSADGIFIGCFESRRSARRSLQNPGLYIFIDKNSTSKILIEQ